MSKAPDVLSIAASLLEGRFVTPLNLDKVRSTEFEMTDNLASREFLICEDVKTLVFFEILLYETLKWCFVLL